MPAPKIKVTVDDAKLRALIAQTKGPVQPAIVADGVEYGLFQEMGVENGFGRGIRIPARPFMRPAVEAVRAGFTKAMKGAITSAKVSAVIRKTAFDVERGAKQRAPVDTGALKNSIHVTFGDSPNFEVEFEQMRRGKAIE